MTDSKPVFLRLDGYHCPEITDDPKEARKWINAFGGKVVRVDETTEVESIELAEVTEA